MPEHRTRASTAISATHTQQEAVGDGGTPRRQDRLRQVWHHLRFFITSRQAAPVFRSRKDILGAGDEAIRDSVGLGRSQRYPELSQGK